MPCLHVGPRSAEIPRLRVGAVSTTRRDVRTKPSVGLCLCRAIMLGYVPVRSARCGVTIHGLQTVTIPTGSY